MNEASQVQPRGINPLRSRSSKCHVRSAILRRASSSDLAGSRQSAHGVRVWWGWRGWRGRRIDVHRGPSWRPKQSAAKLEPAEALTHLLFGRTAPIGARTVAKQVAPAVQRSDAGCVLCSRSGGATKRHVSTAIILEGPTHAAVGDACPAPGDGIDASASEWQAVKTSTRFGQNAMLWVQ